MTLHNYTRNEVANLIFEKYGKLSNIDLEGCKKLVNGLYSNVVALCKEEKIPYDEDSIGESIIRLFEGVFIGLATLAKTDREKVT